MLCSIVVFGFSLGVASCVDVDPFSTDVALEDVPGDYAATQDDETQVLSISKDGSYLLKRMAGGSSESLLGFWKGVDKGTFVDLSLECADDPRTDPFAWSAEDQKRREIEYTLGKISASQQRLPNSNTVRDATARKNLSGSVTITESIDGGGPKYTKKAP